MLLGRYVLPLPPPPSLPRTYLLLVHASLSLSTLLRRNPAVLPSPRPVLRIADCVHRRHPLSVPVHPSPVLSAMPQYDRVIRHVIP